MEPVRIEGTTDAYKIVHLCKRCGIEKKNGVAGDDSPDAIVALAGKNK